MNNKDSAQYEKITSEIVESIYKNVECMRPRDVKYGSTNTWEGASGYEHQIDVTVEGPNDLIMVECKYWSERNVTPEHILTFIKRVEDIKPKLELDVHAMLVTKKGFSSGVKKLAEYYNIELVPISSPEEFGIRYKELLKVGVKSLSAQASILNPTTDITNHDAQK